MTESKRLAGVCTTFLLAVALICCLPIASAATAVGDAGHFLRYVPQVYLHNPDGRAFTAYDGNPKVTIEECQPL